MQIADELRQIRQDMQQMKSEIAKLRSHNLTLLTLIGNMMGEDMVSPSIHEASILFDLSKQDLRQLTDVIKRYDGDLAAFKTKAAKICRNVTENSIFFIVEGFRNSGSGEFVETCQQILDAQALVESKNRVRGV